MIVDVAGTRVWSEHFSGPSVKDVFSVTKTVVATLIGVALERGDLPGLEVRVDRSLGRGGHPATAGAHDDGPAAPASRANRPATPAGRAGSTPPQTLRHLLTMTRGARCDGPWNEDAIRLRTDSWVRHICSAPQVSAPGTTFIYDNGGAHLAAAVLDRAVGGTLLDYAERHLFAPLGITDWTWLTDPEGVPCGYAHLKLTAEALVTLGRFWSHDGSWLGRQVVPASYLNDLRTARTPGGGPENRSYGYLTWVEDSETFFAAGWAGQLVLCRPRAEAVVVTTADPRFDPGPPPTDAMPADWRAPLEMLRGHVLPLLDAD
jgi:CubicO group peptidase (beta-lactamase class C family)